MSRAFTLIELLVVVAIIGILISLAFPIISTVQDSAKKAAARADMQSIVTAVENYHAEYRKLPLPDSCQGDFPRGAIKCEKLGITLPRGTHSHREYFSLGWMPSSHGVQNEAERELYRVVIATLRGSNRYKGKPTELNPRKTCFMQRQEGRPIDLYMDAWSKGLRLEAHPENRLYQIWFDTNFNGIIRFTTWKMNVDALCVLRCLGPNRKAEKRGAIEDDIFSIPQEEFEKRLRGD